MTNLIAGTIAAVNLLATNHVEFRTNVYDRNHPTNVFYIYKSDDKQRDLIPFLKLWETNIVRVDTLEYTWKGQRVVLESKHTTLLNTQAVFQLNLCNFKWERVP